MGSHCCHSPAPEATDGYRRVLWTVIAINGAMFLVEATAGLLGHSVALQADALDFLGDTATYAISLLVLGSSLRVRAGAALLKGGAMAAFGVAVLVQTVLHGLDPGLPNAAVMGGVGIMALAANVAAALLLFRHRGGDANRRSVWLCSRNDAIGNIAVVLAASGVFASGGAWPDLAVGAGMALLALSGAWSVLRQASGEWRHGGSRQQVTGAAE